MRLPRSLSASLALAVCLLSSAALAPAVDEPPTNVDLQELVDAEYEPGKPLAHWISELEGKRVRVSGYMHGDLKGRFTEFLLVTDACVCGGRPEVNQFLAVALGDEEGHTAGMIDVIGAFACGEEKDGDGYVTSVYRLTSASLE